MNKETSGGKKNSKPKIFGVTTLQLSEEDAVRLVGGVVEKGFSDNLQTRSFGPSAAPRPTVLPFPVARHRSHGPHWAPKIGDSNAIDYNDGMDDDFGEEEDCDGMELAAAVANPVPRKQKKDLDFSRWQEIVKNENNSALYEKKKERRLTMSEAGHKPREKASDRLSRQIAEPEDAKLCGTAHVSSKEAQEDSKMLLMQKSYTVSGFTSERLVDGEEGSLESQIDSENRARLLKMSADEIAEAQAAITAKLNPELIMALKKRGQAKMKRQESSLSDINSGEANGMQQARQAKNMSNLTTSSDNLISNKPAKIAPGGTTKNKYTPNITPRNSSTWDAWSKRVEHVRDMRFSLDGNIMSTEFVNISDTGNGSSESGYNADNVSDRDFLRTEGDPGAAGYTIKEAVALTRSVVPGQRTLALHLIAAILDRAICNICQNKIGSVSFADAEGSVDWEAIWAFALGPEPELALSLRMSLDDNHNSVVLACAKAIHCVLSCDMNDVIFDISEKIPTCGKDICTAPVFRSKPDVELGFLRGGFWKYNTKPSNILPVGEASVGGKAEDEPTIQDDVVVAGQDFAAGLVRMGILPRICYLLETDPSTPLEECLISILIAISRHSPTCASAVMDCGKLVQTIANRFASTEQMGINACKIKSVTLLKVLAQLEKKNCLTFIKNGIFRQVTWHLYQYPFSIDQWVKSGREACKLLSALQVEQLRLWKVFFRYGYCISEFPDLFASLCIWLSVPKIEKLIDNDVLNEYCAITNEAYLLLGVLACRLPNFYLRMHERLEDAAQDRETCSWDQFGSIIDQALEWIAVKSTPHVSTFFDYQNKDGGSHGLKDSNINSLLWVLSSILNMLSSMLKAVIPVDTMSFPNGNLPWLPDFVPRIGLEIIKNGYLRFSGVSDPICNIHLSENGSILDYLCDLRLKKGPELAISSTCCLQGLFQVVASVDKLIHRANLEIRNSPSNYQRLSREDKVLANGMLKSCVVEVQDLLTTLMTSITNEWPCMPPVEMFGRGGPAPGVGVGWGASCGGYWSLHTLLAQQDARLVIYLLEISEVFFAGDPLEPGQMGRAMQRLNCALAACLILGPGNSLVIDKILEVIFQEPVLKYLDFGIRQFLCHKEGKSPFGWNYEEEEFLLFANVLATHFRNRWLSVKKKRKAMGKNNHFSHKSVKKETRPLETIQEDMGAPSTVGEEKSLRLEWAYQRLPLPAHWFLSAVSTIHCEKIACSPDASDKEAYMELPSKFIEIAKAGLFFLLGIEVMPTFLGSEIRSPVKHVPVVWKLHAMSVMLLSAMSVLEDEKSRDVYETLQNFYGESIDEDKLPNMHVNLSMESLQFESVIHENYGTFIEMLVEQFAAESYGDMLFGRQVAIYLHRSVEASVRLATWNALYNARALELLPPLPNCCTTAEGYLEPIEDNERILESYVKSWVAGALDKAATRNAMAFPLVLHHLSCFIFGNVAGDMLLLRDKLAKSLIRDYSRKQQHEGMVVKLICYKRPNVMALQPESVVSSSLPISEIEKRLQLLKEVCGGNATPMQKLESRVRRELNATAQS